MSRQAVVSFSCDGPGCDETTVSDLDLLAPMAHDDWFSLARPGDWVGDEETLHFCSAACLHEWSVFCRIAHEEGL